MRSAANHNALRVSSGQDCLAREISAEATRMVAGVSSSLSKQPVYSITATSPRFFTSSRMTATAASTSSASSRFKSSNAANSRAKPGAAVSGPRGVGGRAGTLEPGAQHGRVRLEREAIDNQARGHVGDGLDLDQAVFLEGAAG